MFYSRIFHFVHCGQGLAGAASRYLGLRSMVTLLGPMYCLYLIFVTNFYHLKLFDFSWHKCIFVCYLHQMFSAHTMLVKCLLGLIGSMRCRSVVLLLDICKNWSFFFFLPPFSFSAAFFVNLILIVGYFDSFVFHPPPHPHTKKRKE